MPDRRSFHDERATFRPRELKRYYHRLLERYYRFLVPPGARTLEVGCGIGDLLGAIKPSHGVGIDFSAAMIEIARKRHPRLEFYVGSEIDPEKLGSFDFIILSDLVNDLPDVQELLEQLRRVAHPRTRLVLNFFNQVWRPLLGALEGVGLKAPTLLQNWLSFDDMKNLLHLGGWEMIRGETRILCPMNIPVVAPLFNRWLAPILPSLCLTIFQVARISHEEKREFTCSIVIPARNEAGNIEAAVRRTPEMGKGTEIIFIEGHSSDGTWEEIERVKSLFPTRRIVTVKQQSKGKGGAVREAFAVASGELLFILDADLTMPPEQLPKFYEVARSNRGEFVNGVRLVYPMEEQAMQFLNMIANKMFSMAFTWLIGQPVKDTLCGTKVLFRSDYDQIAKNRGYFGEFDPFGDFDLLFGASRLNLKIVDLPIRYQARSYGSTNINRWRHGALLLRMVWFAARRLRFL
ncbi:MAG: glycosyltransferase [Verrucomicrobiota bacterium]|nr:glycosyltransferase [Verrucomicrobiota bacterium]